MRFEYYIFEYYLLEQLEKHPSMQIQEVNISEGPDSARKISSV